MAYSPPLDSLVAIFAVLAILYGIIAFLVATIVEIIVLWRLEWGSLLYSLLTSFMMNLASTIVGFIGVFAFAPFVVAITGTKIILFPLFIISFAVEGGVMLGINRFQPKVKEMKEVWGVAFIANVISYILLGIGLDIVW